ncbi:MAG: hypothetical protein J5616_04145, partial [Bacteroidaceae bacterium]|nr:hypothetical protein [Bacteroidaceae bacterium]
GIDRQFSPRGRYITPLEAKALHPLTPNLFQKDRLQEIPEEEFVPITQKDHVLQNVTVKAKRRYFTNDDYMYKNEAFGKKYAALYYNVDKELDKILDEGGAVPTVIDFVNSKLKADLDVYGNREDLYHGRKIEWIYDNYVQYGFQGVHYESMGRLSDAFSGFLDEVKSIYIVFNGQLPVQLMTPGNINNPQGMVYVYVYHHFIYSAESQKGLRKTYFQGFNKPSTFQMEDYNVIPPMADFRRTIYWNPDIRTDKEGKAKVEFFNNSTCQEMYISVEGITEDGRVLVNE